MSCENCEILNRQIVTLSAERDEALKLAHDRENWKRMAQANGTVLAGTLMAMDAVTTERDKARAEHVASDEVQIGFLQKQDKEWNELLDKAIAQRDQRLAELEEHNNRMWSALTHAARTGFTSDLLDAALSAPASPAIPSVCTECGAVLVRRDGVLTCANCWSAVTKRRDRDDAPASPATVEKLVEAEVGAFWGQVTGKKDR